jgi:peroxiredoxin
MFYSTGRRTTDPGAVWTIAFDTANFHRPAPSWLRDLSNQSKLIIRKERLGKTAPLFKLTDLDGNAVELSSMRGKVVLLDFWSTACGPCIREIPSIQKAAEHYKDNVILWGLSMDQSDHDRKWLVQHQQSFPTLADVDYVVSDLYKVHGIPAAVVISRKGQIVNYWEGEVPMPDLEAALAKASGSGR